MSKFMTADQASKPPLLELSRVVAIRTLRQGEDVLPKGATGTVVYVYAPDEAFEVEFTDPVNAVISVNRSDLEHESPKMFCSGKQS